MSFGNYIKKRRIELDLTQAQLAKSLGIVQNYIAYLEQDARKPSNEIIKKLSEKLSLPLDRLYLLANPDVKDMFPEKNLKGRAPQPPLLKELSHNTILRKKHDITDEDIHLLSSIQPRGEIRNVEDYVYLLLTIRRLFQE